MTNLFISALRNWDRIKGDRPGRHCSLVAKQQQLPSAGDNSLKPIAQELRAPALWSDSNHVLFPDVAIVRKQCLKKKKMLLYDLSKFSENLFYSKKLFIVIYLL